MHININLRAHLSNNGVEEKLRRLIAHLADSAKYIAFRMGEANRKMATTKNLSGEQQLELDILSDDMLLGRLQQETSFGVDEFASEEQDHVKEIKTHGGRYSVAVDPLDGSSLVDVNLSVGTIIGIHDGPVLSGKSGRESMVAAMYIVYGPLTTLIYTARQGVHEFVLDPAGNFVLAHDNIVLKEKGSIYSPGGLKKAWIPEHREFIDHLEQSGYKLRYSGGFVPDINQILIKGGGLFSYPKLQDAPNGKLRLLFECQPMALIMEEAGGRATDGETDLLDLIPDSVDQRTPIYVGSRAEVAGAKSYLSGKAGSPA